MLNTTQVRSIIRDICRNYEIQIINTWTDKSLYSDDSNRRYVTFEIYDRLREHNGKWVSDAVNSRIEGKHPFKAKGTGSSTQYVRIRCVLG